MGHKRTRLNIQRDLMNRYGYLMDDSGRAWNESKLRQLEAEALEEAKEELRQSVREEMSKANVENAKQFAGEMGKVFRSLGLK